MIPNVWNSCIYIMLVSYRDGSVFSLHEPGPTRGKVSRSRRVKRVLEGAKAAVGLLDCALHRAIGLTTPRWRKGVPVEVVVVHLARSNGGGGRRRAQDGRGGGAFTDQADIACTKHQASSTVRCSMDRMKGGLHPTKSYKRGGLPHTLCVLSCMWDGSFD